MSLRKIFLTGGAGYVGAVLVPELIRKGYIVKVYDLYLYGDDVLSQVKNKKNLIEVKGDLRDYKLLVKELGGMDAVIHLACISNDPSFDLDPTLGKSINYDATVKLFELAKKAGVKRFIFASSSSVYGVKKEDNVTEDLPLAPLTDYSKYKAMCEPILLSMQDKKFIPVVLRPATVCGYSPRLRLDLTVNILTMSALVNKKIVVNGGAQKRPNIHIKDMVDAYILMLSLPDEKVAGKTFNVGYENYSLDEIALMVKKTLGDKSIIIEHTPTNDLRSYKVSSEKIYLELGFKAKHKVEEAIGDLADAYKAGKIPDAMTALRYFNIKTMQAMHLS